MRTYVAANAGTLRWMLSRPPLFESFLNTKQNSITLADYSDADGWRGPDFLYGWIQGRGLEAIGTHAAFFERDDAQLASALDASGRSLYRALGDLHARYGHAYFCYDGELEPVYPGEADAVLEARTTGGPLHLFGRLRLQGPDRGRGPTVCRRP